MINRALLALAAVSAFAGCATGVSRIAAPARGDLAAIETRTYHVDYNVVYAVAKRALEDEGYDIATSNKDAGVISTRYRSEKMSDLAHATASESRTRASVSLTSSADSTRVRARWFRDIYSASEGWHDNSRNWTVAEYRPWLDAYFELVRQYLAAPPEH
jgi:hypothetical protein